MRCKTISFQLFQYQISISHKGVRGKYKTGPKGNCQWLLLKKCNKPKGDIQYDVSNVRDSCLNLINFLSRVKKVLSNLFGLFLNGNQSLNLPIKIG